MITSSLLASADDAATWRDWIDQDSGDYRNLLALLQRPNLRRGIRARVLVAAMLTGTNFRGLSYPPVELPRNLSSYSPSNLVLRDLDPEMARLAANVIHVVLDQAEGFDDAHLFWRFLRQIIGSIPDRAEAEALFKRHPLNDPKPYSNMNFASGYEPFSRLLHDPDLDTKWKRRADSVMREIVVAEARGKAVPRVEWESAPERYLDCLTGRFYSKTPYDRDLFGEQLAFIAEFRSIPSHHLGRIVGEFSGEEHVRLRHLVARSIFLGGDEPEVPWDRADCEAAELLLAEFGPFDALLADAMKGAIARSRERAAENEAASAAVRAKRHAIEERMVDGDEAP